MKNDYLVPLKNNYAGYSFQLTRLASKGGGERERSIFQESKNFLKTTVFY